MKCVLQPNWDYRADGQFTDTCECAASSHFAYNCFYILQHKILRMSLKECSRNNSLLHQLLMKTEQLTLHCLKHSTVAVHFSASDT